MVARAFLFLLCISILELQGAEAAGGGAQQPHLQINEWCPRYHLVNAGPNGSIYDPSGPIKVKDTWHVFADGAGPGIDGAPSGFHWESTDLLRWRRVSPGWWSGLTGAITRTAAGLTAIFVDANFPGNASCGDDRVCMQRRVASPTNLSQWSTDPQPVRHPWHGCGGMDPGQGMFFDGSWRVPSLGNRGEINWMQAADDTLSSFVGGEIVVNETLVPGWLDTATATWHAQPYTMSGGDHFECPDIFRIEDHTIVFASLSKGQPSNSLWWVGDINKGVACDNTPQKCSNHPGRTWCANVHVSGQCDIPPAPCPPCNMTKSIKFAVRESGQLGPIGTAASGALDYGNWYSAKHGSDSLLTNGSRNVVFGVAGLMMSEHTALRQPAWMAQCRRYHTIPRDLTVDNYTNLLSITPIPEIASLRNRTYRNVTSITRVGSQIQVLVACTGIAHGARGAFGVDVLATASGQEYTRLGVNLSGEVPTAFVDTSRTGSVGPHAGPNATNPGTNVVPLWQLHPITLDSMRHAINLTILVDGGMIEGFFGEQCPITTLVQPSATSSTNERFARSFNTAEASGVACDVTVYTLNSLL